MKKQLITVALGFLLFSGLGVQAQALTESFSSTSFPTGWTQSNTCNSTSSNASWKLTTSTPGYGASGFIDNTGATGSYAMWVDGSSPYPCAVSITTDSIDVSTLTTPSIEFYWAKNNTGTYVGNNVLTVDVFDGQNYHTVWSGQSDNSSWRQVQVDISCLTLNNDIALRFTVDKFNGSASFYNDIVVDDIKVQDLPTGFSACAAPTSLVVSNVSTSATATVGEGCNSSATTEVIYGLAGFNPYNGGSSVSVSSGTATLTGLTASSTYEAYAVTSCSSTSYSDTLGPVSFTTPCAVVATPYSENFDATSGGSAFNPSLPVCWEFYTNTTSSSYYPYVYNRNYSFYANSGSNFLYAYRSSSSSTSSSYADTTMVMTPEIQGLDSATKQLTFYARTTSVGRPGEVIIGLTDASGTPGSLRIIDTIYAPNTTYSQYTVYLDGATTGDARVAFAFMRQIGTYDYVCLDDVEITDIPPCPEPISLGLASAGRTSATINWSSSSSAFDIEVGPMGFTQGTGTSYTSTTTSVTATNLTQNTYYDAYVRANCSSTGDGTSTWVGPFTFKTECGWFASPYEEDFGYSDGTGSSSNPDLPDCWKHENRSSYAFNYCYVDKYWYYGNQATDSAYIYLSTYYSQYNSQTALGDTNAVILPVMTDLSNNDQQIIFNARSSSTSAAYNAKMAIGTVDSTGDLSTLVIMDTVEFTSTTYADYTMDLDNVPSNAASVAIVAFGMANSGYTYGYNRAYIDRVEIRQAPQCPEVYDVVTTATSDTSGTMSWGDSSVVDEYLIDWGLAGFTQGTGTYDTIVGTTWSNNMLLPGETYEFYIQSVCSAMGINSPWYGPITLEVPCAPTSVPFADGFENKPTSYGNSSNPNLPDCWTYSVNANPGNSYSYGSTSTWSSYSGSGYLYNRQSNVAGDTVVVSLPMIENLDTDGAVLKFWARVSSTNYQGQMAVATTGVTGDYKTAAVAQNMNLTNNTYQQFSVYLDSNVVPAGAQRPAFMFYSVNGSYNYIYLDSVEVEALPSCFAYNFDEQNIQSRSVDLSWDYNGNNSFNIEYGLKGFFQGTGTGSLAGQTKNNVSEPYTLTGLSANTDYEYYVESNCNPGQWYGPYSFSTSIGCDDLFFSEYSEGSSNNKYFEIYNPTSDTLSLSNYKIYLSGNGGSFTNTFMPSGTINPGDVFVVATNQSSSTILAEADTALSFPSVAHFNGDDALILMKYSDTIDVIGTPGIDPGSSWTLTDGATTKNHTLVRKKEISSGQLNWILGSNEWNSYPQNTWSELGSHTSNCINTGIDIPAYYPLIDLLGFWPLDSNMLDYSGNDNHMMESSSYSIGYGSDRYGIPYRARNTGVAFTDIDSLYYLNELTANVWVSISNSSATNTAAFCHSPANWSAGPRWKLWNKDNGDGLSLRSWTQATSWKDAKYGSANLNEWYMLTATFSDGWQRLYVNSVIVDSIQASLDTINVFNSIMIGGTKESSSGTITGIWQGSLDEAGIWGRSLSQSEITDIYLGADTTYLAFVPYINNVESCLGSTLTDIDYPDTSLYDIVWYTSPTISSGDTSLSLLMTDSTEVLWAAYSQDNFGTTIYSKRVKVEFVAQNSNPSFVTIEDCDSVTIQGVTFLQDTTIFVNYTNKNNCDSLVTYTILIGTQEIYNTGLSVNGLSSDSTYFSSAVSSPISIGTSPNVYGVGFGARQNLSANQDLNTIVFVHRSDYGSNNDNSSGSLRYDISTDGGTTWSTNQGPIWNPNISGYSYPGVARYPQMGILNSPGNTTPSNATLAVWAPTLAGTNANAWGGALHGNVGIGTSVNNLKVDTTAGHLTLGNSFTQDGNFWGISLDHPNYDIDEYTDTAHVFKGVMDWSADSMIYSQHKAYMPSTNDPTNGKIYGDANIVFDDLGSTGYISLMTYNSQIAPDKIIHPILSKSINGGQSWTPVFGPNLDNLVDNASGDSLKDIFDNITSGWTIGHLTSSTRGHDLALDANGRPHMIIHVFPGKGTNPGTGTLAGDFVFYPGVNLIVDVYLDNGLWKCNVLKQAYTFDLDYDPTNGPVTEANRPQISMSPDREWLFFSWFETDTSYVSGRENQFPDWYVSVYDVNGDSLFNQNTKLAGFGDRHFANVSEWAFDNRDNTYELHSVYSSIDDWGTFSVLSPIDHYYQKATLTIMADQDMPDTLFLCQGDTVELGAKETNAASYLWSTGETSNEISVTSGGLYWVDLLDNSSCSTLSDSVYVEIISNPLDSITSNNVFPICRQDSMMLSAPLGDSYLWSTGDTTQLIEIDSSGTYSVTVTNGDYCSTLSQPFTAVINEYPDAQLTAGSQYLCDTDTLQVSVPSGNSYSWSTSDTTAGISISSAGDYWVTVVDSNLCTSTSDTISIGINALPNDSIVVSGTLNFCDGDFVEFTAYDATANYAWSNGDTTGTILVDQTGQYSLTLTSDSGCVSTTSSFATLNMPLPDAQLTAGSQYLCDTDTLQVSVPSGNSYSWSTSDTTAGISISSAGDYWVTVVDSNLCTSTSDTISIGINALPNDSIVVSGTLNFCDGDFVEFTAYDATANYAWSNGDTTGTILVDQTGQYSLTLISDSGCVSVSSLFSTIAYSLPDSAVSISGSLDLCPDDSVTLFAPTGPYSYSWSNGDSSSSIVVNQGGQFALNVIDGNGCVNTSDTIVVVDLPIPQVSSIIGDTVGIVPLQQYTYVVSQVVGQTYSWSATNGAIVSGQGTNIVSVLWNQTNTGTLSVTTTNGYCEDSTSVSIRTNIGVDDFGLTDFSLYPNPTQGKLVIETDFNTDEILIYNAQGRLIQVVSTTGERHQLDISNYSAGVYWIEIENVRKRVVLID